ncbi:response regulator [Phenylobacterium sp.]|uniref:response regulator n=1 Tax=Phenylobacterium sp. TaxID=1871053 RepID=UPI0025E5A3D5|nr:response regulator [Phenylobacterium sp.]
MQPQANPQGSPQILVVDDDDGLRSCIADYLAAEGYEVRVARDAPEMDQALAAADCDLVVLDVMLPGEDGLSICRRLSEYGGPPIIMLSAVGEEVDRIVGLELGADDYLAKPCRPRELLARVRAVLRRRSDTADQTQPGHADYGFLGFTLDSTRRLLRSPSGVVIMLSAGEFALLLAFLTDPRRILSRDELIEKSKGLDADVFDRAVDVQISRLRRKLNDNVPNEVIRTVRGRGYVFDAAVSRSPAPRLTAQG